MIEATGIPDGPASTTHEFNPPSDPLTPAEELTKWLNELDNIDGAPHVYSRPVSFADETRRRSQQAPVVLDANARATVSAFFQSVARAKRRGSASSATLPGTGLVSVPRSETRYRGIARRSP